MDRRFFVKEMLTALSSFSLIESLFALDAIERSVKPICDQWAIELNECCADLKQGGMSPSQWQIQAELLFRKVPLHDLLRFIDFDRLVKGFEFPDLGVQTKRVDFPVIIGLPQQTAFVKKIFGMKKDRAILPHGHSHMVSSHLVLKGDMHLRQYEKMKQENQTLIIKPSIDQTISLGQSSSISDEKNNVHWFIAQSETAFTFDVIVLDLQGKPYEIHNLDMDEKQDLPDGNMRVAILDVETALKKYGKTHHP